jgi:flagellar M-ring protein FliF
MMSGVFGASGARILSMAGIAAALIGLFIYLTMRVSAPTMALLYGDLETADSSQIVGRLEAMNVPFEIRNNGTQVYVPDDQVARLRLSMAQDGLPSGGSIGYEIFDKGDALGTTSFVQNINRVRALEGELARTIRSIDKIQSVRVHLVLPERELFTREEREPSASIIVKMRGATELERAQITAIQYLVAAAVPKLKSGQVSIVDAKGNLLSRGLSDDSDAGSAMFEDYRRSYEGKIKRSIESLVERIVGPGNARAEVSAELDYDRVSTDSEVYDPEGQVVRSTQTIQESANSSDSEGLQPVTVGQNLPDAQANEAQDGTISSSRSNRTEETVNFEISKTISNRVKESGGLRRLSVAVVVDGRYDSEDPDAQYQPRSEEELRQIDLLVKSAVGYDEDRGDLVEVVNMQFARAREPELPPEEPAFLGLEKDDYLKIAEIVIFGIVALLVVLLVLRPLVSRALSLAQAQAEATSQAVHAQIQSEQAAAAALTAPKRAAAEEDDDEGIDLARVEGQIKASSLRKIGDIVDKHPDETLAIIRNWMYKE